MLELRLYLVQRLSAALLAPLVLVHLGVMIYAIHDGLSAAEILERTRGSLGWGAFYGLFVLAAAAHAAIGVRNILREWPGWRGAGPGLCGWLLGLALVALGLRAVFAVVGA